MLKMNGLEALIRLSPETFIMIYFIYSLSGEKIQKCKYILTSIMLTTLIYIVRLLPIYFGVHTIISMILYVSTLTILKIPLVKSICNTLVSFLILEICELLNMYLLGIFNIDVSRCENHYLKSLYGMPSLLILLIIVLIFSKYIKKLNL